MIAGAARQVMALALRCLPCDGGEWGRAMQAEFDVARQDGRPLRFAIGCLWAASSRLPFHPAGRFALASHILVLGLLVPIAVFHLGCVVSAGRFLVTGSDPYYAMMIAKGGASAVLAERYRAAAPAFMVLLFLLGLIHLLLAWWVLDSHWRRVSAFWLVGALVAAAIVGLIAAVAPSLSGSAIQVAALAIELAALPPLAAWQRRHSARAHH